MNRKGLGKGGVFAFMMLFMGIIVALSLIQAIGQSKGQMVDLKSVANESLGTLTNGTTLYITAYKHCTGFMVWNATGDEEVASSNYTVTNNVVYNGQEAISVDPQVTAGYVSAWDADDATFQGTCQPLTYIGDAGGRTMANLIVIFSAFALLGFVIWYWKEEFADSLGI